MDQLLTAEDVADLFKVVPKTVNAWVRRGLLVPTDMGGVRRFALADVEAARQRARRVVDESASVEARPSFTVVGQGWNESACRPYGMTMAQWQALGLTQEQWVAQQTAGAERAARRTRRRRKAG